MVGGFCIELADLTGQLVSVGHVLLSVPPVHVKIINLYKTRIETVCC